jgi:hypothetical protein
VTKVEDHVKHKNTPSQVTKGKEIAMTLNIDV